MENAPDPFLLSAPSSLHPEAAEEGEEGQEEAAGGAGVRVQEEGARGGRSEALVLILPFS